MARNRSSRNRRRNRRGGMLVRESVIQRGVGSTGLYSIPIHVTDLEDGGKIVIANQSGSPYLQIRRPNDDVVYSHRILLEPSTSTGSETVIRISSLTVGGISPFYVDVRTPAANVLYQVPGSKVTKIVPSRENSIMGNPALFLDAARSLKTKSSPSEPVILAEIDGTDLTGVDITVYLVVGTLL